MRNQSVTKAIKRPAQGGFTIVETLIVLAIAGLILMIVLIAVPALTRSSRNNQRKEDVQAILEFVSRYELNHSGDMPANSDVQAASLKLTYYDMSNVTFTSYSDAASSQANSNGTDADHVEIYNYQRCDGGDGTNDAAGFNDVAALYSLETSSGTTPLCQQL